MLDFILLLEILLICAAIYGVILLIRFLKGRIGIYVRYGSTDVLSELGDLRKDKSAGATGYEVKLTADANKTIGKVIVKDEVGWVYLPKTEESYSNEKSGYRKVGYVDAEGYIYVIRKGCEPERIGYLAKPSTPNVPTIIGERNWKDLKWTSRLNVYYGDPDGWGLEDIETVEPVDAAGEQVPGHNSAEKPVSQDLVENNSSEPFKSQSFAATPPARKAADLDEELVTEEPVNEEPATEVPVTEETESGVETAVVEEAAVPVSEIEDVVAEEPVVPVVEEQQQTELPETEEVVTETEEVVPEVEEAVVEEPVVEEAPVAPVTPVVEEPLMGGDAFKYVVDDVEAAYLESVKKNHSVVIAEIRQNMVKVEGGAFMMGVEDEVAGDYDNELNEGPAHKVNLDSYCIGRYPVTQKQWTAIMGYNHCSQINDEFPVAPVDWNECMLFVSRLNQLTGLKFSLPTEAQWEYAARGGNRSNGYIYAGSNSKGVVVSDTQYSPVGKKKPNELGIYDMSGLVREWCSDWYAVRYSEAEQYNPMGPAMPEDPMERKHVVRSPFGNETVTNRKGELPDNPQHFKSYGFRLASEPSKALGMRKKPVLVGHSCRYGFGAAAPSGCPITDEARAGAYALFYNKYGKNSYSEYLGQTPYAWKDTALLTSVVYSVLFMMLYFANITVFQMPLLGNDIASIITLTLFYFILWGIIRAIKIEAAENGHTMQPFLTLMNKTLGHKFLDIFLIVLGVLSVVWTYCFYDADLIPLILAITIGVLVNMLNKSNAELWPVLNPMHRTPADVDIDLDSEEEEEDVIPAPEGDVRKDYNWKLDSFVGKQIKAHIAVSFVQSEVEAQRHRNPFFFEKPDMTVADYKNYIRRMMSEILDNENNLLHSKYILQEIKKISSKNELNEMDTLQFVLDFIQESIEYELDSESRALAMPKEYIRYPDELLFDQKGDCDCKAFLATVFYYLMGYDVILLLSRELGHSAVAVSVKQSEILGFINSARLEDVTIEINGRKYYYCETTTDGFMIGDINDGINVDKFETRLEWVHTEDEED